jgi:hypothetical protein
MISSSKLFSAPNLKFIEIIPLLMEMNLENEIDIDVALSSVEFPSIEIDVINPPESPVVDPETYSDVVETGMDQMLVEGVTELKDHPQLESFLENLNDLKNDFLLKILKASEKFELTGSAKVLFSIKRKE